MATVDSLEVKISADAEKASQSIDKLVKKLDSVAKSLGSINTSAMSASINELTGKLSAINGKGFSDLNKSAKEAGGSVSKISETAKRVSKSLSEIQKKYEDLGKGFEIKGSTQQIQKQIDSLTNQLAKAKLAKEDFEKSGKTNLGGYETAVKNVIKYTNQIESLKKQLTGLQTDQPQLNLNINRSNGEIKYLVEYKKEIIDFKNSIKTIMDSFRDVSNIPKGMFNLPIGNLKQSLVELKETYPQATSIISSFENELANMYRISGKLTKEPVRPKIETNQVESKTKEINRAMNELGKKLSNLVVPPVQENNITKLESTLKRLESNIDNLRAKLKNEITMGDITASPDDKRYVELRKRISLAVKQAEAVREKIKITIDEKEAIQKTNSLGNKVEELKEKLKELSGQGLNFGDKEFDETYKKFSRVNEELNNYKKNLDQAGNAEISFFQRMRNALANVNSQTNKTSGSTGRLASSIKKALHSVKQSSDGFGGFAKKIGILYAKLYVLRRGFNALFGTAKSSMDYIEDLNYFNAAFGQVAEKADLKSFKEMGYDSAKAYYNSFSERAEELTQKMSGFKIEESGMAVSTGGKSLGIDPSLLMQNQAMFAQMSSSMGIVSETAGKLSSVFTRLGGDIASLKNEDFQKVWQNMASGMTGMSRAVDKYGMNIREANLQQTLNNIGIDKSISKLTQQEKVLLRTIVMLDSSRAAWGDLAKTMNQPANQLRLLQSNWSNLSRTIGNIFLPIVAKVLPYLNAVTIMLQRFAEQIVKLLGFDKKFDWGGLGATGGADFDIDFGDAEDSTAGMADNMEKTEKKAKKAVDNIQGFDILNKLQDPDGDKDKDKDDIKGLSPAETGKLTGALDKLLSDYDKAWNKAFKGMENKANELANRMQKALVNAWKKGDFSKFGSAAAKWINKGLSKIPWDKIKSNAKKIASSIATFLNGFIGDLDWSLVGDTFADGLNTIIEGAYEFWTKFDFLKFGKSLSTAVNSFINKFDAKKFGKLLGAKLRGMIQFSFGFVSDFNFKKLGEKFGDAINGFFEDMGKVRKSTGLTGWQELARSISTSITGILDTINTALKTVKWEEVGKAIADFLTNIDWWGILGKLLTVLTNTLSAVVKTAISAIAENPAGVIKALTGAFALIFTVKKLIGGFGFLSNTFKNIIGSGITSGINKIPNSTIKNGISSKFGSLGSIMVSLEVLATSVSFAQSAWKDVFDKYDTTEIYNAAKEMGKSGNILAEAATGWGAILSGEFSFEEWATGISEWWEDQWSSDTAVKNLDTSLEEVKKHISEFGKHYNPVTGKTDFDSKEYEKKKNEYLKNLEKESPKLYKAYIEYEKRENVLNASTKKLSNTFKSFGNDSKTVTSRINSLKNEVRNGTISISAYKKIINGTYKSNSEWVKAMNDARRATKYTNGDLDKFNNTGKALEKTLEKFGTGTVEAKNAVEKLKKNLDNGNISFSDYKKICEGSYNNTKDLYGEINKVAGKKVKAEVKASVEGKDKVTDLEKTISGIKSKEISVKANANTDNVIKEINKIPTVKNLLIKPETKKIATDLQSAIKNQIKLNPKITSVDITKNAKNALAAVMKTNATVTKILLPKSAKPKKQKDLENAFPLLGQYQKNGFLGYYKNGGFPSAGQLFIANEAGAELVGNMNGRTAVAPQNDIAEGFAQAITNTLAPVMYAAFKQAAAETANQTGGDVYLDGKKITESVISHTKQISRQRGNNPIWNMS